MSWRRQVTADEDSARAGDPIAVDSVPGDPIAADPDGGDSAGAGQEQADGSPGQDPAGVSRPGEGQAVQDPQDADPAGTGLAGTELAGTERSASAPQLAGPSQAAPAGGTAGPGSTAASPSVGTDTHTVTRPAPWAPFRGLRSGTARSRAAEADLASRASAIVPAGSAAGPIASARQDDRAAPTVPAPAGPEPAASQPDVMPPSGPAGTAWPDGGRVRSVSLSARLMALARMIQIGSARSSKDGFGPKLLADAEDVLAKAGERMRLSSEHTVVVLAGGTGSGKSSLFNRLAGADLSTVGVTRPVTKDAHACVWGEEGSGAILEWLQVPRRYRYSRASALDAGEDDLAGLILLDLPDHDSVMSHAGELVDRLVGMADVMVWVLDPQKYADAAVHRRFLVPMAGHSAVAAVVLNQVDLLDPAQVDDCVADLRRLLDSENLHDVPIVVTSAATGAGIDDLRALLGRGIAARRAAAVRISADLDGVVSRFLPFAAPAAAGQAGLADDDVPATTLAQQAMPGRGAAGSSGSDSGNGGGGAPARPAGTEVVADVPAVSRSRLAERFAAAAGVTALSQTLRSARELRAVDFVGWPVAWFVQRVTGRDPARKARIGALWNDLRAVTAGQAGAQQAEIDNALTELGAELARPLPKPWSSTIMSAVRSRAEEIPVAVGTAIAEVLPAEDEVVWWWRLAGLWQGLLLGAAAVAIAWSVLIVVVRTMHAQASMPGMMSDPAVVPWLIAAAVIALGLGAGTTWLCMRFVASTAEREDAQLAVKLRDRIATVAREMVIAPTEQELTEFLRYREEARVAASGMDSFLAS